MKIITVFGAGKSSISLIQYLLHHANDEQWKVIVVDANKAEAQNKIGNHPSGTAVSLNINNALERQNIIKESTVVISLLPPALHILVAKDCVYFKKHLLTASYIDAALEKLQPEIEFNGLIFLAENGLDPGIDHMSAMKIVNQIEEKGGFITSFYSHCGGLVAPESDDNPWHYKISWNPANVVHAGKAGAEYLKNGEIKKVHYPQLFSVGEMVAIGYEDYQWYPNRDSLRYKEIYGLKECKTFIRTTLRHPQFLLGWKSLIDLQLTDEKVLYETDNKTLSQFFYEHLYTKGFKKNVAQNLAEQKGRQFLDQLIFLGLEDGETYINKGYCSTADILKFALETKLLLRDIDKDKVVMLHQIDYTLNGKIYRCTSEMTLTGKNNRETAMAQTVGLPLAIAAELILNGTITLPGLIIPIYKEIYDPILKELQLYGIYFKETTKEINA